MAQLKAVFVSDLHFPALQADGFSGHAVGRNLAIQLRPPDCGVCRAALLGGCFVNSDCL